MDLQVADTHEADAEAFVVADGVAPPQGEPSVLADNCHARASWSARTSNMDAKPSPEPVAHDPISHCHCSALASCAAASAAFSDASPDSTLTRRYATSLSCEPMPNKARAHSSCSVRSHV